MKMAESILRRNRPGTKSKVSVIEDPWKFGPDELATDCCKIK